MSPEKEIARWHKTIEGLKNQLDTAQARVAELGEAKRPLTLAAHTGDEVAKSKLAKLNTEIRAVEQETVDLSEAILQAEAKLTDAEAEKARRDEVERLKKVREIAEQRIQLATTLESQAEELADLCEQFRHMSFEMGNAGEWPVGDSRWARADGRGRLLLCLQKYLGANFGDPANPRDLRISKTLAQVEREALAEFLLSDRGIKKVAENAA